MPSKRRSTFRPRFGKRPARRDDRNLRFAELLLKAPRLPAEYDFDGRYAHAPTPMFANDAHGDCVIAGRAHHTLRFEFIEQHGGIEVTGRNIRIPNRCCGGRSVKPPPA